jgi:hypothetical protein
MDTVSEPGKRETSGFPKTPACRKAFSSIAGIFLNPFSVVQRAQRDSISRNKEGNLRLAIIKLKPNPGQRDFFDAGFAFYQGKNYTRSDSLFTVYTQKWPDENFWLAMEI